MFVRAHMRTCAQHLRPHITPLGGLLKRDKAQESRAVQTLCSRLPAQAWD